MNATAAHHEVIDTAQRLSRTGLVVRTWGNMSVRVAPARFLITPSGRSYDRMIPADLVSVTLDGRHTGHFSPSSEHPMHAQCYRVFADANAVVHTHQPYASALSLLDGPIQLTADEAETLGQAVIPIGRYALPSTSALHHNVGEMLAEHPEARAFLLANHGALVVGSSGDDACDRAERLERVCRRVFERLLGPVPDSAPHPAITHSVRTASGIRFFRDSTPVTPMSGTAAAREAEAHRRCYRARRGVNAIVRTADPHLARLPEAAPLRPYLDDFAQIVGVCADRSPRHNAVLLGGGGSTPDWQAALCLGATLDEARAAQLVLHKNALAARVAAHCGAAPIAAWECRLMNLVYRLKYSRKAGG